MSSFKLDSRVHLQLQLLRWLDECSYSEAIWASLNANTTGAFGTNVATIAITLSPIAKAKLTDVATIHSSTLSDTLNAYISGRYYSLEPYIQGTVTQYEELRNHLGNLLDSELLGLSPKVLSSLNLKLKYLVDRLDTYNNLVALL